ncbi:MAG: DUF4430 domain-containing protein [Clostridia bacterium]|nr:DUF4430 domain-containing protein [Clostridia bacterium]
MKRILSALIVLALACTMLFACTPETPEVDGKEELPEKDIIGEISATAADLNTVPEEDNKIVIDFIVTHSDGNKVAYAVKTDKDNLGDALLEEGIINGDKGEFGIYVTEVDGEEASWEKDSAYWYFYKDGEALMTGISSTPIADGDKFEAVYTK